MRKYAESNKRWFRIIGAAIVLIGFTIFAIQLAQFLKTDKDGVVFEAPGAIEVRIKKPEDYLIYYEYDSETRQNNGLNIVVYEKDSREEIPVAEIYTDAAGELQEGSWDSMFRFFVDEPSTVIVEANYDGVGGPSLMIKASSEFMSKSIPGILKMAATVILSALAGGAVFLIPNFSHGMDTGEKAKNKPDG